MPATKSTNGAWRRMNPRKRPPAAGASAGAGDTVGAGGTSAAREGALAGGGAGRRDLPALL